MKPNNDARPHSSGDGLLVVNLGTPAAPTASAVRRYLAEFLGDPRVVELPRLLWYPVLYGVILPLRGMRSAAAYRRVWTDQGSPLLVESQQLTDGLSHALPDMRVALAMRYGEPSIPRVLSAMNSDGGLRRLFVLPLYPQYSATTTATVFVPLCLRMERTTDGTPLFRATVTCSSAPSSIRATSRTRTSPP